MRQVKTKISEGGRVVIPAEYRKQLGLEVGDEVIIRFVDGEIRIFTPPRQSSGHKHGYGGLFLKGDRLWMN